MAVKKETHMVRLTGVLIVNGCILIIEQAIRNRSWYLPGGKLEKEETLEEGIKQDDRVWLQQGFCGGMSGGLH